MGGTVSTERLNPPELSPPTGFSHAVVATGTRVVFLAGQTALDTDGKVVGETLPEQFERALTNLLTALRAAGEPRPTSRGSPSTPPMSRTTELMPPNSGACGGGWRGATTPRWRSSARRACGTSAPWSNSTVSRYWRSAVPARG